MSSIFFIWDFHLNERTELAVDGDGMNTCAVTEKGANEYWRIQFDQMLTVKGML